MVLQEIIPKSPMAPEVMNLSVDSISNNLTADTVGHCRIVIPIHGSGLELPEVMETDHIVNQSNGMSDKCSQ